MKLLHLPVSSFVKKILISENDEVEPITPNRKNETLYIYLSCQHSDRFSHKASKLETVLSETISIKVSNWLYDLVSRNPYQTGWILHRCYRDEMLKFIRAKVSHNDKYKNGVLDAIYEFSDMHDLEPDVDFELETMKRYWRRFKALHNAGKIKKKAVKNVRNNSTNFVSASLMVLPYTDIELDDICNAYISKNGEHFLTKEGKPYKYRGSQLRCWVYSSLGGRRGVYIAKKMKMKQVTVYNQIYSFSALLRNLPPIQE